MTYTMDPISDRPQVGPYMGVQKDKIVTHRGREFRIILYAACSSFDLIRSELNGIAVLDEDQHTTILVDEACIDSGRNGASEAQKKRFDEIVAMPWEEFKAWVNAHPNLQAKKLKDEPMMDVVGAITNEEQVTPRKVHKSDVALLVPRRHWCLLRDQLELTVQLDEENNNNEWREIVDSIVRIPDKTWMKLMADEYVLRLLRQPEISMRAVIKKAEQDNPRATYLLEVLNGERNLSGSDLGNAGCWPNYKQARIKAAEICREEGGHIRKNPRGKLTLEWSAAPRKAKRVKCAIGVAWAY